VSCRRYPGPQQLREDRIQSHFINASRNIHNEPVRTQLNMNEQQDKPIVHFLHIGKTGGSAVKYSINHSCTESPYQIMFHSHGVKLRNIPGGEKVIFILRDPVSRFVSGFYSRLRKGKPRYYNPWNSGEKAAFSIFTTPNHLAGALSSWNLIRRYKAHAAMSRIQHLRNSYVKWLESEAYLLSRQDDILFIAFQERLVNDFEILKKILGCPASASLPVDDRAAHRSPDDHDTRMDKRAVSNIKKWYRHDYHFIDVAWQIRNNLEI